MKIQALGIQHHTLRPKQPAFRGTLEFDGCTEQDVVDVAVNHFKIGEPEARDGLKLLKEDIPGIGMGALPRVCLGALHDDDDGKIAATIYTHPAPTGDTGQPSPITAPIFSFRDCNDTKTETFMTFARRVLKAAKAAKPADDLTGEDLALPS